MTIIIALMQLGDSENSPHPASSFAEASADSFASLHQRSPGWRKTFSGQQLVRLGTPYWLIQVTRLFIICRVCSLCRQWVIWWFV